MDEKAQKEIEDNLRVEDTIYERLCRYHGCQEGDIHCDVMDNGMQYFIGAPLDPQRLHVASWTDDHPQPILFDITTMRKKWGEFAGVMRMCELTGVDPDALVRIYREHSTFNCEPCPIEYGLKGGGLVMLEMELGSYLWKDDVLVWDDHGDRGYTSQWLWVNGEAQKHELADDCQALNDTGKRDAKPLQAQLDGWQFGVNNEFHYGRVTATEDK